MVERLKGFERLFSEKSELIFMTHGKIFDDGSGAEESMKSLKV